MKELCNIITPYKCKQCGQDMLFFVTANNTLIDYKALISKGYSINDIKHLLETKNIRFIKCISCNKSYIIDWTNTYPVQLLDKNSLKKFGV